MTRYLPEEDRGSLIREAEREAQEEWSPNDEAFWWNGDTNDPEDE